MLIRKKSEFNRDEDLNLYAMVGSSDFIVGKG